MEANTVSYKVSFKGSNSEPEVRRFVVDRDVSTSLAYLSEKLVTVFPSLRRINFDVAWIDDDGDKVMIKSDDELVIALTEMRGPVYKLSIQPLTQKVHFQDHDNSSSSSNSDGEEHVGVRCDGCERPVIGFRYKCVTCTDYDLCGKCEAQGLHPGHNMIRISTPQSVWPQHFYRRLHRMHEKVQKRRCGGPCTAQGEEQPSECSTGAAASGPSPRCRGPSFRHQGNQWLEAMMKGWTGLGQVHEVAHKAAMEAHCKAHQNAGESVNQGIPNPAFESFINQSSSSEFLKNLGQIVAGALDPFGVDVEIKVDTPEQKTAEPSPAAATETKSTGDKTSGSSLTASTDGTADEKSASPEKKEEDDWTVIKANDEVYEIPIQRQDQSLYPDLPAKEEASASASAPMDQVEPEKPKYDAPVAHHPDPKIQVALQAMMNMGFTDDGGWLTSLLETKGGDIGRVLDAVQPANSARN